MPCLALAVRASWKVIVTADLDTLLIALYVELTDHVIASSRNACCWLGRPPEVTDAELVCLAVAQVLLRYGCPHGMGVASISRSSSALPGVTSASHRSAASISGAAALTRSLYSLWPSSRGNRCPTRRGAARSQCRSSSLGHVPGYGREMGLQWGQIRGIWMQPADAAGARLAPGIAAGQGHRNRRAAAGDPPPGVPLGAGTRCIHDRRAAAVACR